LTPGEVLALFCVCSLLGFLFFTLLLLLDRVLIFPKLSLILAVFLTDTLTLLLDSFLVLPKLSLILAEFLTDTLTLLLDRALSLACI